MRNLGKRGLALFLALMMCLGTLNITAFAAEGNDASPYDCGLEEHTHGDECWSAPELICGKEESEAVEASEGHHHTEDCWETKTVEEDQQVQICKLAETEGHTHGEDCYAEDGETLTCETGEAEGHTHGDGCFETQKVEVEKEVLTCDLEESDPVAASEGHEHTEECYESKLVCEIKEHVHDETCVAVAEGEIPAEVQAFLDAVAELPEVDEITAENAEEIGEQVNAVIDMWDAMSVENGERDDVTEALNTVYAVFEAVLAAEGAEKGETLATTQKNKNYTINAGETKTTDYVVDNGGNYTLTVNGTMKGTVKVTKGTLTIQGSGTIDGQKTGSVITVGEKKHENWNKNDYAHNSTVTLKGTVTIKNGSGTTSVTTKVYKYLDVDSVGGGVCVIDGEFIMEGGTISGNTAATGGGIYVNYYGTDTDYPDAEPKAKLTIKGGTIKNNTATGQSNGGGGGIWINGKATINPTASDIKITGNTSETKKDLGGGGIYVNNSGELTLKNAIITDNTAAGLGGGLATCVHGKVAIVSTSGAAIYANKAGGENAHTLSNSFVDKSDAWKNNSKFKADATDVLCAGEASSSSGTVIINERFDGTMHNWVGYVKSENGSYKRIDSSNNGVVYGDYSLGLRATNTNAPDTTGRKTVTISGNTSASHGGGVGCNGVLKLGATTKEMTLESVSGSMELTVKKQLDGQTLQEGKFTFELLDSTGKQISTAKNDASGNVKFSYGSNVKAKADTYTFYVREVTTGRDTANYKYDDSVYKVTVKVGLVETNTRNVGNFMTVTTKNFAVTETKFTKGTWNNGEWKKASGASATEKAPTFVNTALTKLTVKKVVAPVAATSLDAPDVAFTIQVKLGNGTGSWSNTNTWQGEGTYTFSLKHNQSATITGIPTGTAYVVTEGTVGDGWTKGTITNNNQTANGQTVVVNNSYDKVKETEVNVTKSWSGEGNADFRPDSITVRLNGGNVAEADRVKPLNAANNWTADWDSLPLYSADGKTAYTYSVEETGITYTDGNTATETDVKGSKLYVVTDTVTDEVKGYWAVTESGMNLTNTWNSAKNTGEAGFTFKKVDSADTTKGLEGAEFTVSNGTVTKKFYSDDSGNVEVTGLTLGDWTMTETQAPKHYTGSTTIWTIKVERVNLKTAANANNDWTNTWVAKATVTGMDDGIVTNEIYKGQISVTKTVDFGTYAPLDGENVDRAFTFNVYNAANKLVDTLIVKNGETKYTVSLPYGIYTVVEDTENVAIGNYKFSKVTMNGSDTNSVQVTVAETNGATVKVEATNHYNRETGSLSLIKTVNSPNAGDYTASYSFTVTTLNRSLNGKFGDMFFNNGVANVTVQGDHTVTATGIPVGTTYTVAENGKDGRKFTTTGEVTEAATMTTAGAAVNVTNTRVLKELTVSKNVEWNNTSNAPTDGKAFTITVTFGTGSVEVATSAKVTASGTYIAYVENGKYVFNLKSGESVTIKGIPTGTGYTVTEDKTGLVAKGEEGYSYVSGDTNATLNDNASVTIQNHYYNARKTNLTVKKDWTTTPNEYRQEITVTLVGGPNTITGRTVKLNKDNDWTKTWTDLPEFEGDGQAAYTYKVTEDAISVPADAKWSLDYTDHLKKGIIRVRSDVEAADGKGNEIVGGWVIDQNSSFTGGTENNGITLTNNWRGYDELGTASFSIHKVDSEKKTPIKGVKFELKNNTTGTVGNYTTDENGNITISELTVGTYTLTETGVVEGYRDDNSNKQSWTLTFTKDASHKDKLQSVKAVDERGILGENKWSWKASSSGSTTVGSITIENKPIEGRISITKYLNLDGVTEGITDVTEGAIGEPARHVFTFEVYPGADVLGADTTKPVATLTVKAGETDTTGLLRYGTYTIKEVGDTALTDYSWVDVAFGGECTVNADGSVTVKIGGKNNTAEHGKTYAVTATNSYTRDVGAMSISKTVTGNMGDRTRDWHFSVKLTSPAPYVYLAGSYAVQVTTADGAIVDQIMTLGEDGLYEGITLKHGETAVIEGLPVGTGFEVTEVEANKDRYYTTGSNLVGTITVSTGDAIPEASVVSFNNDNTEYATASVQKVWANDEGIARPASVRVQLLMNGEVYDEVELNEGNNWQWNWNFLPYGAAYEIREVNVPDGYVSTTTRNGNAFIVTNTYNAASVSVQKVWAGDEGIDRPVSVRVQLLVNGAVYGEVELNEGNNWQYTWDSLPYGADYQVREVDVPDGYESEVTQNGNMFIVTNTYTEDIPDEDVPLTEIPDDDVPLAYLPHDEEEEDIPDDDVPLVDVPRTGDNLTFWLATMCLSAMALAATALGKRKEEDDA